MKYAMLIPAVILVAMFTLWPLGELVSISLHETDFITTQFVGFKNYVAAFKNQAFLLSLRNSALYIVLMVALTVFLPLLISLALWRLPKRWLDAGRIIMYLPSLAAGIIISQVWRWIFHIQGPINWILVKAGLPAVNFFGSFPIAIISVALTVGLTTFGANIIIILAIIVNVNRDIVDAAQIDGASWMRINFTIVLPEIMPTVGLLSLMAAIGAPQIFETIQMLAPFPYAATASYSIFTEAFHLGRHGGAAAQAMILLVLMIGLAIGRERLAKRT